MFQDWLEKTLSLQREAYGTNPPALDGANRAEYIRWNVLAAIDELTEFLNETQWKPWAGEQGKINNTDAATEELVDVLHFVANLLCVLDVNDELLSWVYEEKMKVNRARQESGSYMG